MVNIIRSEFMKKIILFAAVCAALSACIKPEITESNKDSYFEEGQVVTLTVNSSTRATGAYDSTNNNITFNWSEGDSLKVTVEGKSANFALSSGAGESSATFTGKMPASGSTFDVQYPASTPDLSNQTYVANGIASGLMLATASNCASDTHISLTPQYAVMKLNLYDGDGKRWISSVKVTANSKEYVLSGLFQVGDQSSSPESCFIVLPTGEYSLSVAVYKYGTVSAGTFSTTGNKTFTAGEFLNMVPQEVDGTEYPGTGETPVTIDGVTWAPVNCGYDATNYPMGLLYQWGRQYGQAYEAGTITPTAMSKSDDTEANKGKFGEYDRDDNNWFSGGVDNTLWSKSPKGTKDPCPNGWRVPTMGELKSLMGKHTGGTLQDGSGIYNGIKGKYFDGSTTNIPTNGVFLPAAGTRNMDTGNAVLGEFQGSYWSSFVMVDVFNQLPNPYYLHFEAYASFLTSDGLANGHSVRCVKGDAQDYYPGTEENPISIDNVTWAPVNCGYDSEHPYGLLYQWGRKYGSGYDDDEGKQNVNTTSDVSSMTSPQEFYTNWNPSVSEWPSENNPCPSGWRVPTYEELCNLSEAQSWDLDNFQIGSNLQNNLYGYGFYGVFIPAAGLIYSTGNSYDRPQIGYYWSSEKNKYFHFSESYGENCTNGVPSTGYSVRCVKK